MTTTQEFWRELRQTYGINAATTLNDAEIIKALERYVQDAVAEALAQAADGIQQMWDASPLEPPVRAETPEEAFYRVRNAAVAHIFAQRREFLR